MKQKLFYLLVLAILVPSLGFTFTVVRKDGRSFSGELVERTSEHVVIRDNRGITVTFKTDQIDWKKTGTARLEEEKKGKGELKFEEQNLERKQYNASKRWTGELISVDFKDIDIKDFFRFIAEISGMNMILDPAVKGSLTLKLTEVPWDQALDLVCRTYGLGYQIEGNVMGVDKY
jgi:type II secretory pathway component HofQ